MPVMGGLLGPYLPPPPTGSAPPSRWGDEAAVTELLRPHAIHVRVARRSSLRLSFVHCTEARDFLIRTAGNVLAERSSLEVEGRWSDLEHELENLVRDGNKNSGQAVELDCEYLLVLADASIE